MSVTLRLAIRTCGKVDDSRQIAVQINHQPGTVLAGRQDYVLDQGSENERPTGQSVRSTNSGAMEDHEAARYFCMRQELARLLLV